MATKTTTPSPVVPAMNRGQVRVYLAYFCAFAAQERPDVKSTSAEMAVARWRDEALAEAFAIAKATPRDQVEEWFCSVWQSIKADAMDVIGRDFTHCKRSDMFVRNPSGRRSFAAVSGYGPRSQSYADGAKLRARARSLAATFE
jgi:hypothetical protein